MLFDWCTRQIEGERRTNIFNLPLSCCLVDCCMLLVAHIHGHCERTRRGRQRPSVILVEFKIVHPVSPDRDHVESCN